jgi:hypothetical protein
MNSWQTAVQLHSTVRAIEAHLGEKVERVIVQGLNKGYVSQYDRQESIFCYYYGSDSQSTIVKTKPSYVWRAGLKKFPTWKLAGGVKQWVAEMPLNILSKEFPQTPPIFINDDLVDAFFRQRAVRERQIRASRNAILEETRPEIKQALLDAAFPQSFEECNPGWGRGCPYRKLCHGHHDDPLKVGFEVRRSHHEQEQKVLDNQGEP